MAQGRNILELTRDFALVKRIATHPKIWPTIGDDFAPRPADWQPEENPAIKYLLVRDAGGDPFGFYIFFPDNPICWQMHVCMLPAAWGKRAERAMLEMFRWAWRETQVERITGAVPSWNVPAIAYALRCGMEVYGVNRKCQKKDGKLHDMVLLGISRPAAERGA